MGRDLLKTHSEAVAEPPLEPSYPSQPRTLPGRWLASMAVPSIKGRTQVGSERALSLVMSPRLSGRRFSGRVLRSFRPTPGAQWWRRVEHRTAVPARRGHHSGGPHPVPTHAQRQLHQGHGRRGQRRVWRQPQALTQDCGAAPELPESHAAVAGRAE